MKSELVNYKELYELTNKELEAWREKPWANQLREQSKEISKLRAKLEEANSKIDSLAYDLTECQETR